LPSVCCSEIGSSLRLDVIVKATAVRENAMSKGQKRSNREKKKPKQEKAKPVPIDSPFVAARGDMKKANAGGRKT
jgi:hypothetical protein